MSATETIASVAGCDGVRDVRVIDALDAAGRERAEIEANRWIKRLRLARVDGWSLRDRFTYRDDSLWWFAELYLHKRGRIANLFRCALGLDTLVERFGQEAITLSASGPLPSRVAERLALTRGIAWRGRRDAMHRRDRLGTRLAAAYYAASASLSPRGAARSGVRPQTDVAVFVHSAFWRGSDETYVGPVIDALRQRVPEGRLRLIGVGPRTAYRGRGWRDRLREIRQPVPRDWPLLPIETLSSRRDLADSRALWRDRERNERALQGSDDLRAAAVIEGCDCWPLVAEELAGVARLQLPWSARAMDEAGAALDRMEPAVAVTYAEAGGWGRALVLEARRRRIPLVGLQHGFIYRHWLNYQHEPDELAPSTARPADVGFPRPDLTLVFDAFAARHLESAAGFPPAAVRVTGSPRLDALVAASRRLDAEALAAIRRRLGATGGDHVVLVASKFTQIGEHLPALLDAASAGDIRVVIKCHPAETAEPYERLAADRPRVVVAPADADLASLILVSQAVVTVHSTVAIDAMVLERPSLVVALPSNLTPFVDAGAMAGAATADEIGPVLRSLLYDEEFRARLAEARAAFMRRYQIGADGEAADRAADAVLDLRTSDNRVPSPGRGATRASSP